MLLDVTQQGHAPEDPVLWRRRRAQVDGSDEVHVHPHRLLVDGTGVQPGVSESWEDTGHMTQAHKHTCNWIYVAIIQYFI